jgi:hypothetical protein
MDIDEELSLSLTTDGTALGPWESLMAKEKTTPNTDGTTRKKRKRKYTNYRMEKTRGDLADNTLISKD